MITGAFITGGSHAGGYEAGDHQQLCILVGGQVSANVITSGGIELWPC